MGWHLVELWKDTIRGGLSSWLSGKESACPAGDTGDVAQSLGWEGLLEKEMATHSSTLAREIPWTEESWWATVHGVIRVGQD